MTDKPLVTHSYSARFASYFLESKLTLLLAICSIFMGVYAFLLTPREDEPPLTRTLVDIMVALPGASAQEVEAVLVNPLEQVLDQMQGIEHIVSVTSPHQAVVSVYFESGVKRTEALVDLYNVINSHADWVPADLKLSPPLIKPKDNDDIPVLALVLRSNDPTIDSVALHQIASRMETALKRVSGTREVTTIGGQPEKLRIVIDPLRLRANDLTLTELHDLLKTAHGALPLSAQASNNQEIILTAGNFFTQAEELRQLVITVRQGQPVYLHQVADIYDSPGLPNNYVWHGFRLQQATEKEKFGSVPAVVMTLTKQTGENVTEVVNNFLAELDSLHNTLIPAQVTIEVVKNYGDVANDKVQLLMTKIGLVILSVAALIFFALGRRESAIVLLVVVFTLSITVCFSLLFGFSLNRSSLFAAIISIGLLVDDAVVVIENIHRHHLANPGKSIRSIVPAAIDEIGGATILATFTVIAALMPMAFVTGVSGEYFFPVPIITSMSMLASLLVAFALTPWLAVNWMKASAGGLQKPSLAARLSPLFTRSFSPLLDPEKGSKNRKILAGVIAVILLLALSLPVFNIVSISINPPDNKSETAVMIDMPPGTSLEGTARVASLMAAYIQTLNEVSNYQVYVGVPGPVGSAGLMRKYYLREGHRYAEIQINLVDKHHRKIKSHEFAEMIRPALTRIAAQSGAEIKVFDPPPGPPVFSPIVAEIYGPSLAGRREVADAVRQQFEVVDGVVDINDTNLPPATLQRLSVDRNQAALASVNPLQIVNTLALASTNSAATYLHAGLRQQPPVTLELAPTQQGNSETLLQFSVRNQSGDLVPLNEIVTVVEEHEDIPIYHKDLDPVEYVMANTDARLSSPTLAILSLNRALHKVQTPSGEPIESWFRAHPEDTFRGYSVRWAGDWQVTYETFRDLGAAYIFGLFFIYLLIVSQFRSYLVPLIIMLPIPLTIIGLMFGHALLGTQFTVSSLVGLMVLAGLIVRNSILLVDFIKTRVESGTPLREAVIMSANIRAQPIILTSLMAMVAALFLLDDPMFNGLAIALIFGNLISTGLTLVVIPTLYFAVLQRMEKQSS